MQREKVCEKGREKSPDTSAGVRNEIRRQTKREPAIVSRDATHADQRCRCSDEDDG